MDVFMKIISELYLSVSDFVASLLSTNVTYKG